MAHDHGHHHHHHGDQNIKVAFFINLAFTVFEIIGGMYTNSVAILSDALHDLGDSFSLGVAWYLQRKSRQGPTRVFTFGYQRFSLLGALVNSVVLVAGSIFIIKEAVGRILEPQHSNAQGMFVFAIVGVLVNGYAAWRVSKGKSLNERVVSWHLVEDVLGWVAVMVVSIILMFKDNYYLDPALSLLITLYVLWNVLKRLRETVLIFLQGSPSEVDIDKIINELQQVDHVNSLHHTHTWSLDGEHHVFTTHLVLQKIHSFDEILEVKKKIREVLKKYPLSHHTIEVELDEETCSLKH